MVLLLWLFDGAIVYDAWIVLVLWSRDIAIFMVRRWCYLLFLLDGPIFYGRTMVVFVMVSRWCNLLWSLDGALLLILDGAIFNGIWLVLFFKVHRRRYFLWLLAGAIFMVPRLWYFLGSADAATFY